MSSAESYRFRSPADVHFREEPAGPGFPGDLSHTNLIVGNAFLDLLARKLEVETGELAAHRLTLITYLRTHVESSYHASSSAEKMCFQHLLLFISWRRRKAV